MLRLPPALGLTEPQPKSPGGWSCGQGWRLADPGLDLSLGTPSLSVLTSKMRKVQPTSPARWSLRALHAVMDATLGQVGLWGSSACELCPAFSDIKTCRAPRSPM